MLELDQITFDIYFGGGLFLCVAVYNVNKNYNLIYYNHCQDLVRGVTSAGKRTLPYEY